MIARFQKFLAPKAEVRRKHRLKGRSGRMRQLDVTVSETIGSVPIRPAIALELSVRNVEEDLTPLLTVPARAVAVS